MENLKIFTFKFSQKKSNLFRIYLFNIFNKNKIVIEILKNREKIELKKDIEFAKKILSQFDINLKFKNPIHTQKQIRHLLFTMHDYKTFMKFEKISKKIKIIGGGWYLLGSKLKMDHIKNEIDNLI